ncbi:unnamed protein product [Polarella glacialis]|uniref:Uncharacterized protein n=1 Tax=Polarella glacialis TaxID=89957 RepID=A0A813F0Q2_POLGL|nr:unnamed protein product [Polarella glacialis]CAE8729748.1 unnamed protein product [Polarella glacialis]
MLLHAISIMVPNYWINYHRALCTLRVTWEGLAGGASEDAHVEAMVQPLELLDVKLLRTFAHRHSVQACFLPAVHSGEWKAALWIRGNRPRLCIRGNWFLLSSLTVGKPIS